MVCVSTRARTGRGTRSPSGAPSRASSSQHEGGDEAGLTLTYAHNTQIGPRAPWPDARGNEGAASTYKLAGSSLAPAQRPPPPSLRSFGQKRMRGEVGFRLRGPR